MRGPGLVFTVAFFAARCAPPDSGSVETSGNRPIPVPAADLTALDPTGAPGVQITTLRGPSTGRWGALFKLPAGFSARVHAQTHTMNVGIVSGTYIQPPVGAAVFRLGPGSHLMPPGGARQHPTS